MSYKNNYDGLAGIHIVNTSAEKLNSRGNDLLYQELGRLGIALAVIPGNQGSYKRTEEGILFAHPTFGKEQMSLDKKEEYSIGHGGIEVVRAKVLVPTDLEEQIPVLNGPRLRELDKKWDQYQIAQDFSPNTIKIDPDENPDNSFFEKLQGSKLVIKSNLSAGGSKYVQIVTRSEALNAIYAMRSEFNNLEKPRSDNSIIVQEFVPGLPWSELRGVDEKSRHLLSNAKDTELRIFCFVDKNKKITQDMRYQATARVWDNNRDDEWASIDQDSVPIQAWQIADIVSDRVMEKANVSGGCFAIDLIKGDANDGLGERIFVRESNFSRPDMVSKKDNLHDAVKQRELLANLMAVMIKNGK